MPDSGPFNLARGLHERLLNAPFPPLDGTAMRILMLTNTYPPVVSGVAKSIVAFDEEFRRRGHEVLVIAPQGDDVRGDDSHVVRVPAIQHFNGSDFPLPVPSPGLVAATVDDFQPDVIHAHHPFFLGNSALRLARSREMPLVFTHHTMYDQYTHYTAVESQATARFVGALTAGYAGLCDAVIAPSQSVAAMLPSAEWKRGSRLSRRALMCESFARKWCEVSPNHGIATESLVIGYVARLAPKRTSNSWPNQSRDFWWFSRYAHFLVVGSGPSAEDLSNAMAAAGCSDRLHLAGLCEGQDLVDAFHAMDVFAFASQTETQGMVLTEAMAAGKPVVAPDGPGIHDVVRDR